MYKIRKNVFETNSSSVHSIVIDKSGLEPSYLEINEDGEIVIELGEFGRSYHIYNTQDDKLSYLLTSVYYLAHYNEVFMKNSWEFKTIERLVCEYTGAKKIVVENCEHCYIDHQMVPEYISEMIVEIYDDDEIINFIFNKYVSLKTYSD